MTERLNTIDTRRDGGRNAPPLPLKAAVRAESVRYHSTESCGREPPTGHIELLVRVTGLRGVDDKGRRWEIRDGAEGLLTPYREMAQAAERLAQRAGLPDGHHGGLRLLLGEHYYLHRRGAEPIAFQLGRGDTDAPLGGMLLVRTGIAVGRALRPRFGAWWWQDEGHPVDPRPAGRR